MEISLYSKDKKLNNILVDEKIRIINNGSNLILTYMKDDVSEFIENINLNTLRNNETLPLGDFDFLVKSKELTDDGLITISGAVYIDSNIRSLADIKRNSNNTLNIELQLNYNEYCMELLDKNLKNEVFSLKFTLIDNKLSALYNNEVVAEDMSSNKYNYDLDGCENYILTPTSIKVVLKNSDIGANSKSVYSSLYEMAEVISYDSRKVEYMIKCGLPVKLIESVLEVVSKTNRVKFEPKTLFIEDGTKLKASLVKFSTMAT